MSYVQEEMARIRTLIKEGNAKYELAMVRLDLLTACIEHEPVAPVAPAVSKPPTIEAPKVEETIIINDEWKRVLDMLNDSNSGNIFVTGEAGTGKSTLLRYFVENSTASIAIVAPTGVAALRVNGETIHRFFQFGAHALEESDIRRVTDSRRAKYKALDVLVIDEVSMVRADVMDAIDRFLRLNGRDESLPFGGCKIVMFGDLFQLPPVAKEAQEKQWLTKRYGTDTPYFFHAEVWRENKMSIFNLTTIFRQKDEKFTSALNAIRKGAASVEHLALINSRVNPKFKPQEQSDLWLTLTTTNASADQANQTMLRSLKTEARVFEADIIGDFDLKNAPTDAHLELKPGAVVMFIRNHALGYWVNGTLGKVTSVSPLSVEVNGVEVDVEEEEWEAITYEFNPETNKLSKSVKGSFVQIPLRLASAITIHKSQGMTFDRCVVDFAGGAFAAGQAYVALSRCRTLEGMVLRRPLQERDLFVSDEVRKFMAGEPIAQPKKVQQLSLAIPTADDFAPLHTLKEASALLDELDKDVRS